MKTLETVRLILRGWALTDLDDFFEYATNPSVGPKAGWKPHSSKDETLKILNSFIEKDNVFAVVLKENNKVIGSISLCEDEKRVGLNSKEIGYALNEKYWNKGYMTEAVRRVIAYVFEEMGLDALAVSHFPDNLRSKNVIEKCGFTYEGLIRHYAKIYDGSVADEICYSMLKKEYFERLKQGK